MMAPVGWLADWVIDHWIMVSIISTVVLLYLFGPLRWLLALLGVGVY